MLYIRDTGQQVYKYVTKFLTYGYNINTHINIKIIIKSDIACSRN